MKLIVVHISGLATPPREELDGRSLLEAAQTDALDDLARRGVGGTVRLLPEGVIGGPGAELLGLLDYLGDDVQPPSLGVLEALGAGVPLHRRDVAFRINLSSLDGSGVLTDTAGAGINAEQALSLMAEVDDRLSRRWLSFYPGRHFAHVMVWTDGPTELRCTPGPAAEGRPLEGVLPEGEGDGPLRQLIWDSVELLDRHRINHERREEGLPPVNVVWPWAPGLQPDLRHFALRTGLRGLVIAHRLQVLGAARACGLNTATAARTTEGMQRALLSAAQQNGLSYLHLDLRELLEHPDDPETHVEAVRTLDTELIGPTLNQVRTSAEAVRLLVLGTWPVEAWEERAPALWAGLPALKGREGGVDLFAETALAEEGLDVPEPGQLLREALAPAS